jgi:hypothetical protein
VASIKSTAQYAGTVPRSPATAGTQAVHPGNGGTQGALVCGQHVDAEETGHNERLIAKALATYPGIPPRPIALTVTRPMILAGTNRSLPLARPARRLPRSRSRGLRGPAMSTAMFLLEQLRPAARHAAWLMPVGGNSDRHG